MDREALTIAVINGITSSEHYFKREVGIGRDGQGDYHVGCLDIGARKCASLHPFVQASTGHWYVQFMNGHEMES